MEETISLRELFQTLRKRMWLIVAITVIATMTSGIVSYFVLTPIYQASTQLLVNQAKTTSQFTTLAKFKRTCNLLIRITSL